MLQAHLAACRQVVESSPQLVDELVDDLQGKQGVHLCCHPSGSGVYCQFLSPTSLFPKRRFRSDASVPQDLGRPHRLTASSCDPLSICADVALGSAEGWRQRKGKFKCTVCKLPSATVLALILRCRSRQESSASQSQWPSSIQTCRSKPSAPEYASGGTLTRLNLDILLRHKRLDSNLGGHGGGAGGVRRPVGHRKAVHLANGNGRADCKGKGSVGKEDINTAS